MPPLLPSWIHRNQRDGAPSHAICSLHTPKILQDPFLLYSYAHSVLCSASLHSFISLKSQCKCGYIQFTTFCAFFSASTFRHSATCFTTYHQSWFTSTLCTVPLLSALGLAWYALASCFSTIRSCSSIHHVPSPLFMHLQSPGFWLVISYCVVSFIVKTHVQLPLNERERWNT